MAALYTNNGMAFKSFSRTTGYPFSMFCRVFCNNITSLAIPLTLSLIPASGDRSMSIGLRGDEAGDKAKFRKANVTTDIPESTAAFSAFTWYNIGGSAASATDARVYLDGVRDNGAGTSIAFPTPSSPIVCLGHLQLNGSRLSMLGGASDFAIWNSDLTDAEHASLAKGFSPRRIRPQSLVFYAPLVRNEHDIVNAYAAWSYPGSAPSITSHRRIYGF